MQYTANNLHEMVVKALAKNDVRQAISACQQLNKQYPEYFEGWHIAGEIHKKLNKPKAGLVSTERALNLQPKEPRVTLQRVECLLAVEETSLALQLLLELAENNNSHKNLQAKVYDRTAMLLAAQDHHQEALLQYEIAISVEPENASLHYNQATALRFLGNIEEAELSLNKCLAINPLDFEAQAMRSSLRKQTKKNNHSEELKNVLNNINLQEPGKVNISYALAKEFDDLDEYENSFKYLSLGAAKRREQMAYDVTQDIETLETIRSNYQHSIFSKCITGKRSNEPIFIIGLPRTGTTLVERIIGSHSDVYAAGELDNFGRELTKLTNSMSNESKLNRSDLVKCSTEIDFFQLGECYINSTRPATGHTKKFIDKLPFNYLYAGLIHLALPDAKIINITRHPMAACYAIYKQLFRDVYPFSYNLNDLGRYYIAYRQLIEHWRKVMPGVMYDLSYEQVVADTEKESRALLEFSDLPWEEQCLRFYENKDASTTASATQVRQPVYNTSVDRWRQYSRQLQPLQEMLEQAGINCD